MDGIERLNGVEEVADGPVDGQNGLVEDACADPFAGMRDGENTGFGDFVDRGAQGKQDQNEKGEKERGWHGKKTSGRDSHRGKEGETG